jgi:deoxycytidylate deaminase
MNALMFADRKDYFYGTIYVTSPCCYDCAKAVSNSGVSRVVVRRGTKDSHADVEKGIAFLKECGVVIEIMKDEDVQ